MGRFYFIVPALLLCLVSCMKQETPDGEENGFAAVQGQSMFVINSGQFGYGNSTLSCYDTKLHTVASGLFYNVNGFRLGDTGQSMSVYGDTGWIVVNNSKVIFAVDMSNMKEKGRITGLTSPRYISLVSDSKAYVTDLYENRIVIANPQTFQITGAVDIGAPAEQMVISDGFMYVNCWSYGKEIIKIDLETDRVADRLEVGVQPCSMALDADGNLWVLTDGGGWAENPAGYEKPALVKIDMAAFEIESKFFFNEYVTVSNLQIDPSGTTLYWLASGVWKMDVKSSSLPGSPFIESKDGQIFYALTTSPYDGDIFISDAVDYMQNGKVYRYSSDGTLKDEFPAGVCPVNFCWY